MGGKVSVFDGGSSGGLDRVNLGVVGARADLSGSDWVDDAPPRASRDYAGGLVERFGLESGLRAVDPRAESVGELVSLLLGEAVRF